MLRRTPNRLERSSSDCNVAAHKASADKADPLRLTRTVLVMRVYNSTTTCAITASSLVTVLLLNLIYSPNDCAARCAALRHRPGRAQLTVPYSESRCRKSNDVRHIPGVWLAKRARKKILVRVVD
jgi:hypothetical protein